MINSIKNANLKDKIVLCRFDYNVPLKNGEIMDDTRIQRSLPTVRYILENGGKIVATSHLGRPKGNVIPELSLQPVAKHLEELLGEKVEFVNKVIGEEVKEAVEKLKIGNYRILVLENVRFEKGETKNNKELAKELASLADLFVSDGFGVVHRSHASSVGVSEFLPSYAGLLIEEEYTKITETMKNPVKPTIALIGGAKVSTKLDFIKNFINIVDTIVIGGGMAFTFLKSMGYEVGSSLVEENMISTAADLIKTAKEKGVKLILPIDIRISKTFDEPILEDNKAKVVKANQIPKDTMGLDIGPESEKIIADEIKNANTIFWNGPMGVFEKELYRDGTRKVAQAVIDRGVITIIGGGDTIYALNLVTDSVPIIIHVSTGGGASLELMSGLKLPGIECLMVKN